MNRLVTIILAITIAAAAPAAAQTTEPPAHQGHDMASMSTTGWSFGWDGVVFGTYSNQGGVRGEDEFVSTDWLMGMASRQAGPGRLTLTSMMSVERATTSPRGYREIFQVGEAYRFVELVDFQHPHDLFMQIAASWRIPLTDRTGITFVGAPVGEPALGPTAFMHRPSAAENSVAPLSHHTLDSTHITMGVITAAVDHGPWTYEGSVFQSIEPDDNRWDVVDWGPLDSWSGRVWYRKSPQWQFQASYGYLAFPERTDFVHVRRATASAEYFRQRPNGYTAMTFAFGRNDKQRHGPFHAGLIEATWRRNPVSLYTRLEGLQAETQVLLSRGLFHSHGESTPKDPVFAATGGAVHELFKWKGFEVGAGGEATFYGVAPALREAYGEHPVTFRLFFRVRLPAGPTGRMWNMRMAAPHLHQ